MLKAFESLIATKGYGGKIYSITPDFGNEANPNKISDEECVRLALDATAHASA